MDKKNHSMQTEATLDTDLMARIRDIWEASRQQVIRSVNSAHVCANWLIGKQIVEAEQGGEQRATYGKALLKSLSQQLTDEYGSGFSESSLKYMRLFFLTYPDLLEKSHALRDQSCLKPTNGRKANWNKPYCRNCRISCWNWAVVLLLSGGKYA